MKLKANSFFFPKIPFNLKIWKPFGSLTKKMFNVFHEKKLFQVAQPSSFNQLSESILVSFPFLNKEELVFHAIFPGGKHLEIRNDQDMEQLRNFKSVDIEASLPLKTQKDECMMRKITPYFGRNIEESPGSGSETEKKAEKLCRILEESGETEKLANDIQNFIKGKKVDEKKLAQKVNEKLTKRSDLFRNIPKWREAALALKSQIASLSKEEKNERETLRKKTKEEKNKRAFSQEPLKSGKNSTRKISDHSTEEINQPKLRKRDRLIAKAKILFGNRFAKPKMQGAILKEISSFPESPSFRDSFIFKTLLIKNTGRSKFKKVSLKLIEDWIEFEKVEVMALSPELQSAICISIKNQKIPEFQATVGLFFKDKLISNQFPLTILNEESVETLKKTKKIVEMFGTEEEKTGELVNDHRNKAIEKLVEMLEDERVKKELR